MVTEAMHTAFEEILRRDGHLVYKTRGVSMEPMLHENRDLVILQAPSLRLKKYDVALYKRENAYVLHRVIGVEKERYLFRGDNT
ncbi:MAG: S26 family signal peptidase, partial [Clostridia bacterium]|nr:S26 family signal peptidase [Clostridia bacterium]